jgi:hypothetical protein
MPAISAYWRIASARSSVQVQLHLVKSTGTAIVIGFFPARTLGGSALGRGIVLRALKSVEKVSVIDLVLALKQDIADGASSIACAPIPD